MKFLEISSSRIIKYRKPVIFAYLLLIVICLPGLFRLNVTVEMDDYFLDDDPVLSAGKAFGSVFDDGDFVGVLLESPDVYSRESLELAWRIGTALSSSVPGARTVTSIVTQDGTLTGGHSLEFDNSELLSGDQEIEAFRNAVTASPLLGTSLVSPDQSEAWILLSLEPYAGDGDEISVGRTAWEALEGIDAGEARITPSGIPVVAYRKYVELTEDLIRVIIIAAIVAVILSTIVLRSIKAVLGTLGVFAGAVISVLGIQGWAGATLDSGFLGVPILLTMGISIGYTVHVHRYYKIGMGYSESPAQATAIAVSYTIRPLFYTAVTTIAALLSFFFVDIKPIRWVGHTSGLSVLSAFLLSVLFFPAVMSLGRGKKTAAKKGVGYPERFFKWIVSVSTGHGAMVIVAFVLASGMAVFGLSRLNVDFDAVEMMGTRLPHMQDQIHVGESEIAVGEYMNLMLTMPGDYFQQADAVRRIAELESRLSKIPGVRRVSSITRVLSEVNSLMHRRKPEYSGLPESDVSLGALMRLLNGVLPEERGNWVDDSGSHARLFVELSEFSSKKIESIIDETIETVDDLFPGEVDASVSGSTYQVAMMNQYITRGLVRSIGTALIIISLIMILVFRSLRWGLVAMIPNIFPVLVAGAVLGFAGIPLEFVTMTVAPIILGLAVDDTIHFMSALRVGLKQSRNFHAVLEDALLSVGTAISQTTFILCAAFLIFSSSRVNSIRYMGIIAATGMFAAYLADLLLVPVLTRILSASSQKKKSSQGSESSQN